MVFLDLKRAFETININLLLAKLERMGFKGIVLKWLENYLKGRTQVVKYNSALSDILETSHGVPQGQSWGHCFLYCI